MSQGYTINDINFPVWDQTGRLTCTQLESEFTNIYSTLQGFQPPSKADMTVTEFDSTLAPTDVPTNLWTEIQQIRGVIKTGFNRSGTWRSPDCLFDYVITDSNCTQPIPCASRYIFDPSMVTIEVALTVPFTQGTTACIVNDANHVVVARFVCNNNQHSTTITIGPNTMAEYYFTDTGVIPVDGIISAFPRAHISGTLHRSHPGTAEFLDDVTIAKAPYTLGGVMYDSYTGVFRTGSLNLSPDYKCCSQLPAGLPVVFPLYLDVYIDRTTGVITSTYFSSTNPVIERPVYPSGTEVFTFRVGAALVLSDTTGATIIASPLKISGDMVYFGDHWGRAVSDSHLNRLLLRSTGFHTGATSAVISLRDTFDSSVVEASLVPALTDASNIKDMTVGLWGVSRMNSIPPISGSTVWKTLYTGVTVPVQQSTTLPVSFSAPASFVGTYSLYLRGLKWI